MDRLNENRRGQRPEANTARPSSAVAPRRARAAWPAWLAALLMLLLLAVTPARATNGVYREVYTGLSGSSLLGLTNSTSFPNFPSLTDVLTNYFEGPYNYGEYFGDRFRALIVPPVTGTYVFWVQGDDAAVLFLSPDESAFNKVQLAVNTQTALYRQWYKYTNQQSAPVHLLAGRRYYIEAIHSAGGGDDAFAVGWKLPDGTLEQPIPITRLIPFGFGAVSAPSLTRQPTNATVLENAPAVFSVGVSNLDAVTYQWQRGGTNLPGLRGASCTLAAATTNDHGATFRCVISNAFGVVHSSTVTLTVVPDATRPALLFAASHGPATVQVDFTEPVEPATATNAAHYSLSGGMAVASAAPGVHARSIVLTTTAPLVRGSNYTLTVNNVRDNSAARNVILPNSQHAFTAQLKGLYRELYHDMIGSVMADLTNHPAYPAAPSVSELLPTDFETPSYHHNNYGQRLRARLTVPLTGNYTFWIAAHNSAVLLLGTNAAPASARPIASVAPTTLVCAREWDVQAGQRSLPIPLVAGQQYYIETLLKGGLSSEYPPDHLGVRWQLPNGLVEEAIPCALLTPVGLNSPQITTQPAGVAAVEGSPATFTVAVGNLDPVTYQWQQNGTNLPGSTNATHVTPAVALAENNSVFHCLISNPAGATASAPAALHVTPDVTRPALADVANYVTNGSPRVSVYFSEPVDPATATATANYAIPGLSISAAVLLPDARSVTLTTSPLTFGSSHTVTVNRVRDRAATFNVIATNSQRTFTAQEFFLQGIGPAASATVVQTNGSLTMTAGDTRFSDTNDAFNFAWQQRIGDFDVKVRVARLDFADTWTTAGLMAREGLGTNSPYAAVLSTPSVGGTFFQFRTNAGVVPQMTGAFPVNYPYTWLRLQRIGGTRFNGFASYDGEIWTQLGTVTLQVPSRVYLGFTVSSRNPAQTAQAQFMDFQENTSTVVGTPIQPIEPPGPSSRRTGLAISEIMFHPADRTDGRQTEFVEIYNSNPFPYDLGGHRLSGDISFTFPPGTLMKGGAYIVVARNPADLQAVYGIANVTGPYANSLPNSSGTVRLRNRESAILLEVDYRSRFPWPPSADGAGHSLVLARPSFGEGNAQAWAASDLIGGSPGSVDGVAIEPARNILINEYLAHTDPPLLDYIELYNRGLTSVNLSGFWLTDDPSTNKFRIPDGTTLGATSFVHFTETTLGFALDAGGETIFLLNSNRTRVLDSVRFEGQENGVSTGRWPDGSPTFHALLTRTPGGTNSQYRLPALVLNEIMYNPISDLDDDEFVEIHNRSATNVNLTNWRLDDGVSFKFPTNAAIPAGGYVVVAKNPARMLTNYSGLNTNLPAANLFGPYSGTLGNGGERLALTMPDSVVSTNLIGTLRTNFIDILIDETTYGTGGRWGKWSDGGGSSLELVDPRSDNRLAYNWADSDDTAKSTWTSFSFNGYLDNADEGAGDWDSLQVMLFEEGECLLDLVNVQFPAIAGSVNLVTNASFETTSPLMHRWVAQGTHRLSGVTNSPAPSGGSRSLHIIATDGGDTGANRIYTLLNEEYTTNISGTISGQAKWLRGRPELLLRLRGNLHEAPVVMNVPKNLGTPGARNSRYATNSPPDISDVVHTPILPAANQPVVVRARLHDPDGLASVQLVWRLDPFGASVTTNMFDNGTAGDTVPNDGVYAATIPGQADNALIAFYIQATDRFTPAATVRFPRLAPAREGLIHYGSAQPNAAYGTYRFWLRQSTHNNWLLREKLSNEPYEGTFVYGDFRVIYDAASHYAGSPAHTDLYDGPMGTNCDYQLLFPDDDALLDATSVRVQQPGLVGADNTGQAEQTGYWIISQFGVPTLNRRPINMYVNGLRRGTIYEDTQRQNADFDEQWYPDHEPGDLHKVAYWYEYSDDTLSHQNTRPTLLPFTTTNGAIKTARYRQNFPKRALRSSAHNYTNLFLLASLLHTTATGEEFANRVFPHLDIVEWARSFCVERVVNNTDVYGARRLDGDRTKPGGQNAFLYKPAGESWKFFIWDIDAGFLGTATDPFFDFTDPPISNLFAHPLVLRTYWQAMEDAAYGPLHPANLHPPMDARYEAYRASGIQVSPPTRLKDFLAIRRDYMLQILSENRGDFRITTHNGQNFTNAGTLAMLSGTAPFAARSITFNGVEYPLNWSSVSNWTVRFPLTAQANAITVRAYDAAGNLLSNYTRTLTVFYNGPVARAEDSLVINEIMFQPAVSNAHYVEIYNRSTNTTFDLWNYRINGLGFNFEPGDVIAPQSYLMVVKDALAFRAAHGTNAVIAGEFPGGLDRDGESLSLIRRALTTNESDTVIDRVKYEIAPPWPSAPGRTNGGVALQLIDAAQDNGRVSNWDDGTGWRFASFFNVPNSSTPTLYLYLDAAGEVLIDDVRVVHGTVPAVGPNLVVNSSFETALVSPWVVTGSEASTTIITNSTARAGTNSLRLRLTSSGSTSRCILQQLAGVSTVSNYSVSFWYKPVTNNLSLVARLGGSSFLLSTNLRPVTATPGAANWVAGTVDPYPLLWINEAQPNNPNGLLDNTATAQPWIELFNTHTQAVSLEGLSLSKSYSNLNQWAFPAGTVLQPGEFRVVWVDGRPQFTAGTNLHTSFRLDATNGAVILSRGSQILDYINYTNMLPGVSRGSYVDGQLFDRRLFYFLTPGASNNPSPVPVVINEWMASNTRTLVDPSTGTFEDWFELYNFGLADVDLSGFYLTDDDADWNKWRIPNGVVMPGQTFLFCWADGDASGTNRMGDALHTSFRLAKGGAEIALYTPDGIKVDKVSFGNQTSDVSQGKFPDGNAAGPNYFMPTVTPRTNNVVTNNMYAPVVGFIADATRAEGELLSFTATATDADPGPQNFSWSLTGVVPEGASIDPGSGAFAWTPSEAQGGDTYPITVQVSDNGGPPFQHSRTFTVTVTEANSAPSIGAVSDQVIDVLVSVNVSVPVSDPDVPAQNLSLELLDAPAGAVLAGTEFSWTPTLAQGGSTNVIRVRAFDDGSPSLSATQAFTLWVNAVPECYGLEGDANGDGRLSVGDWTLVGRLVAGLNTNAAGVQTNINSCQFEKADCAPRPAGNCLLTVGDWVQTGRYLADMDPSNFVGVCTPPAGFAPAGMFMPASMQRVVCLTNTAVEQGGTNWFQVVLESNGDENGLAFSLAFDTNKLAFVSARVGPGVVLDDLAAFLANPNVKGRVGVFLGLNTDLTFPAGRLVVAELRFRALGATNPVSTPLTFTNSPIFWEVSDPTGSVLPTRFEDGGAVVTDGEKFRFEAVQLPTPGQVRLRVIGEVGAAWNLQHSANLLDWQPLATVTNLTGLVEFIDTSAGASSHRYYRAVKP